jgi:hypothetical protein
MIMSPMWLRTKDHCAGEDQQQFSKQKMNGSQGDISVLILQVYFEV